MPSYFAEQLPPASPESLTSLVSSAAYSITPHNSPDAPDHKTKAWHFRAWFLYNHLAEVAQAARLTANTASLAEIQPGKKSGSHASPLNPEDESIDPADKKAALIANDCLNHVFGLTSTSVVLRLVVENLFVTGEVWLAQPFEPGKGDKILRDEFEVISADDIYKDGPDDRPKIGYTDHLGHRHDFKEDQTVIRFYHAHPRNTSQATSSVKTILDEGESLLLLRQLLDATASSSINNGILGIAEELILESKRDEFQANMVEALTDPLCNPDSAAAVAPHLLIGKGEFLESIKHISLSRDFDEQLPVLMQRLEARIIRGLDLPNETLEGQGSTNHWSSWSINANWVRNHIKPVVDIILETMTRRVLWPKLEEAGIKDHTKYCFVADLTSLAGQPNMAKNAQDAYNSGVLSHEAYLREMGFAPEDMADPIRAPLGSTGLGGSGEKSTARKGGVNPDRPDEAGNNQPTQGEDDTSER